MGRPSDYTVEMAERICAELIEGRSLRQICRDDPGMPHRNTVLRWLDANEDFAGRYRIAREMQADALAEEILEIADDARGDFVQGENGPEVDHENIQRSRLRVDTRKWLASKLAPKRYGDSSKLAVEGADGGPVEVTISWLLTEVDGKTRGLPSDRSETSGQS